MSSNESKNEMLVMVLSDLAAICQKLTDNPAVPQHLQLKARQLLEEFNSLSPYRGKGTASQHFQGEELLAKMAAFVPRVLEVRAAPAVQGQ